MNLLARGLHIVDLLKVPVCQMYTCSDFEKVRIAVEKKLDSYWSDDTEEFLEESEKYVDYIDIELDENVRCMMAIALCLWLDLRITYELKENSENGARSYFSLSSLIQPSENKIEVIGFLNANYKETEIGIIPKYKVVVPHGVRNGVKVEKRIHNRDIFEGLNGKLENCSYTKFDKTKNVKNIIIPNTFLKYRQSLRIGFAPMSDSKDLLKTEDVVIQRDGIEHNAIEVALQDDGGKLSERFASDWSLACEEKVDIFFAPELLCSDELEMNDGLYNTRIRRMTVDKIGIGEVVPKITILPSYWKNNENKAFIIGADGEILGHQGKYIPFTDERNRKIEALLEKEEWITIIIHIPKVHRIAIVICAEFLSDKDRLQKFICGSLCATMVIVPSYSRGEQDFINILPGLAGYGTTVVWGNCCGAILGEREEKAIGGCSMAGDTRILKFGSECKCGFSCENVKACIYIIDIPLEFETQKTKKIVQNGRVCHVMKQ